MNKATLLDDLLRKISQIFATTPSEIADNGRQQLESAIRQVLQKCFASADFVTAEEFDTHRQVLLRTRAELDELQKKIALLEEQKNNDNPSNTSPR